MSNVVIEGGPRRRIAVISGCMSSMMALGHGASAFVFYFMDGDLVATGLQAIGTLIWAGRAVWELR